MGGWRLGISQGWNHIKFVKSLMKYAFHSSLRQTKPSALYKVLREHLHKAFLGDSEALGWGREVREEQGLRAQALLYPVLEV